MDEEDLSRQLDGFLAEVLGAGEVPHLPTFLGEEWDSVAEAVADLLARFRNTMVIEVTRADGAEVYVQFARDDAAIRVELVSNEFLGASAQLAADRVSLLIELGWQTPSSDSGPNFSQTFVAPNLVQLAWVVCQTLHEVYEAEPDHTWAVIPANLVESDQAETATTYGTLPFEDEEVEPDSIVVLETDRSHVRDEGGPITPPPVDGAPTSGIGRAEGSSGSSSAVPLANGMADAQVRAAFQMPKAVTIMGRSSSVTNSFVNSIIPVITPNPEEIRDALAILEMSEEVACAYCGDSWTEWDHLRPIVIDRLPTGYVSEIHNLVPACGKCNQSKGNRHWRTWMLGNAAKSPSTRGVVDLHVRVSRLEAYENLAQPDQSRLRRNRGRRGLADLLGTVEGHPGGDADRDGTCLTDPHTGGGLLRNDRR